MAVQKTVMRDVVDAGFDQFGAHDTTSSIMTGWTTHLFSWAVSNNSPNPSNIYFNNFKDSTTPVPVTPHQDGMEWVSFPSYEWQLTTPGQNNVGLKHYWHQMQAMKHQWIGNAGMPVSGDHSATSPSRYGAVPGYPINPDGIQPVYQGNGSYKHHNINMGNMRGFQYPINGSLFFPSSNISPGPPLEPEPEGEEYLGETTEISVGNYTTPVWGCTDPLATNYNPLATIDDGSCTGGP